MRLFTHSETLTVLPSNFWNGQVIYFQQAQEEVYVRLIFPFHTFSSSGELPDERPVV